MKKLFFLLFILSMVACKERTKSKDIESSDGKNFNIIEIDGCEYIDGNHRLAHKGNCKYCRKEGW